MAKADLTKEQEQHLKDQKNILLSNIKTVEKNYRQTMALSNKIKIKDLRISLKGKLQDEKDILENIRRELRRYAELKGADDDYTLSARIVIGYIGAKQILKDYNKEVKNVDDEIRKINKTIDNYLSGKIDIKEVVEKTPAGVRYQERKKKQEYRQEGARQFRKTALTVGLALAGAGAGLLIIKNIIGKKKA